MPTNTEVCSICGNISDDLERGENGKKYCHHCIEEHHLVKCSHDGCNKYLSNDEVYLSGRGFLCKDHWESEYTWCTECGALIRQKYQNFNSDGEPICGHCFAKSYYVCEDCGEIFPISEVISLVIDGNERKVCHRCRENNYRICEDCGKLTHKSDYLFIEYYTKKGSRKCYSGCVSCIAKVAHQCSHCGRWYSVDVEFKEGNVCEECYYRGEIIHSYTFKPKILPRAEKDEDHDLLFGVENEIELKFGDPDRGRYADSDNEEFSITANGKVFAVDYRKYIAYHIDNAIPGFFYQKHDGSIRYGMEVVSHPATLEFWRSQKDKIEELFSFLRSEGCQGDEADTVGMHIHVSRNKMTRAHQNSFAAFVYSHRKKIEKLAGRESNGYTKMITLPNSAADSEETKRFERVVINNDDRYSAVNWRNKSTVELRMFQSTLNTNTFLANIEFAHALYNFSKERTVLECVNNESWMNFCTFVSEKGYSFLENMMIEDAIFNRQ